VEAIKVLVEAELEAQAHHGFRPLHAAAIQGQADAARLLAELGADVQPQSFHGTPPEISIERGHRQAEQVLRQLERARKAKQDTPREPAASQDTPQAREAADRMAAAILEEEEREQEAAAQSKAKGKGKAKAGKGGAAAAVAAGSCEASSSGAGGSAKAAAAAAVAVGLPVEQAIVWPEAVRASKMEKDQQRRERQRRRKVDEAHAALQWAMDATVKHGVRCASVDACKSPL
jgi:hypothetical protein